MGSERSCVGVEWSAVATVRSGWRTVRPRRRSPSKACGLVTSWTRCRSMPMTVGAPGSCEDDVVVPDSSGRACGARRPPLAGVSDMASRVAEGGPASRVSWRRRGAQRGAARVGLVVSGPVAPALARWPRRWPGRSRPAWPGRRRGDGRVVRSRPAVPAWRWAAAAAWRGRAARTDSYVGGRQGATRHSSRQMRSGCPTERWSSPPPAFTSDRIRSGNPYGVSRLTARGARVAWRAEGSWGPWPIGRCQPAARRRPACLTSPVGRPASHALGLRVDSGGCSFGPPVRGLPIDPRRSSRWTFEDRGLPALDAAPQECIAGQETSPVSAA